MFLDFESDWTNFRNVSLLVKGYPFFSFKLRQSEFAKDKTTAKFCNQLVASVNIQQHTKTAPWISENVRRQKLMSLKSIFKHFRQFSCDPNLCVYRYYALVSSYELSYSVEAKPF